MDSKVKKDKKYLSFFVLLSSSKYYTILIKIINKKAVKNKKTWYDKKNR